MTIIARGTQTPRHCRGRRKESPSGIRRQTGTPYVPYSGAVSSADAKSALHRDRPPIAIMGVPFDNVTMRETVAIIETMIASRRPHYIATANVDFVVQAQTDVELRRILCGAPLVLCDGTPLLWVSRLLGNPLPERVAGSDLVPLLLQRASEKGYSVFFLGAAPESAEAAVARVRAQYPHLNIAGHYSPPYRDLLEMDHEAIAGRIKAAQPDLLLVSFGCPKQEKWMAMYYQSLGVPVMIGVGGTIDFLAGRLKRAPLWMQRSGLEWIYRMIQEPRRLFKRYVKDLWSFGWGVLAQCFWFQILKMRAEGPKSEFRSSKSESLVRVPVSDNQHPNPNQDHNVVPYKQASAHS